MTKLKLKLKWALAELAKYKLKPLTLDGEVNLTNSLKKRNSDLLDAKPVKVKGMVILEGEDQYLVDLNLKTTLTLPSTRSLTPVTYKMDVNLREVYLAPNLSQNVLEDLEDQIAFSLDKDILDLRKPIEDTIIASIPMKILSEEERFSKEGPKGKDWELFIEGEELPEKEKDSSGSQNNPFGILKDLDLFDEKDDQDD